MSVLHHIAAHWRTHVLLVIAAAIALAYIAERLEQDPPTVRLVPLRYAAPTTLHITAPDAVPVRTSSPEFHDAVAEGWVA